MPDFGNAERKTVALDAVAEERNKKALDRDGETLATLKQAVCRSGHFFLSAGGTPMWGVDRVVVRGSVQPLTLRNLARARADADAAKLFGEG